MYLKWLPERGVTDKYSPIKGSQEHHIKVNKFAHKCKATYYQLLTIGLSNCGAVKRRAMVYPSCQVIKLPERQIQMKNYTHQ
jgi:hypothetical protein